VTLDVSILKEIKTEFQGEADGEIYSPALDVSILKEIETEGGTFRVE
jgi:hypothetical protein